MHLSEANILITDLRLSEKGMRCIEGIFRDISGPVPGPIEDCENSCLGSIKPFITGIREDIPVQKHINTTDQQCIKQCLSFKIYHNVMCDNKTQITAIVNSKSVRRIAGEINYFALTVSQNCIKFVTHPSFKLCWFNNIHLLLPTSCRWLSNSSASQSIQDRINVRLLL